MIRRAFGAPAGRRAGRCTRKPKTRRIGIIELSPPDAATYRSMSSSHDPGAIPPRDETSPPRGPAPEDDDALRELFAAVYAQLRRVAHRHRDGEQTGHTLDTTGLVHEAYLELVR